MTAWAGLTVFIVIFSFVARVTDQEQFIEHSVFLGETDNIGEPSSIWNNDLKKNLGYPRSLAAPWDP